MTSFSRQISIARSRAIGAHGDDEAIAAERECSLLAAVYELEHSAPALQAAAEDAASLAAERQAALEEEGEPEVCAR